MDLAGYVINAVLVEGRSVREVAAAHAISKSWVYELLARYRAEGEAGLVPRSKRPRSCRATDSAVGQVAVPVRWTVEPRSTILHNELE